MRPLTGTQYAIANRIDGREHRAIITQVAATLRSYTVDGVDLIEPFEESARPAKGQGIVMVPWAGRIEDGTWHLDGVEQQLAITEPPFHNATHGLLRYSPYTLVEQSESAVTLAATIFPNLGFPFRIDTTVRYELTGDGLEVTHEAVNASAKAAPWACGTHPYLAVGDTPAEQLTLTVPAGSCFDTDDRWIPVGEREVAAEEDLRAGRRLADLDLNTGYGQLQREAGLAVSTLLDESGRGVALWQDDAFDYSVVFTPRDFPKGDGVRHAAAVEPMSAPANAFNSGQGLVWLEPGEQWQGRWGLSPRGW